MHKRTLFVTGATGLIGSRVVARLLRDDTELQAFVLVRDVDAWRDVAKAQDIPSSRAVALRGDVTLPGLGLAPETRRQLSERVTTVLHAAADTVFSNPLPDARRVNTQGTYNLLGLVETWPQLEKLVHVSTAFVVGRRTGLIFERDYSAEPGFVNYYEQSKYEAEQLVRSSSLPWVIARPSTVVCDSVDGDVSQFNVVHRSLRLYHAGLAPMLPGNETNTVDLVTTGHVVDCVVELTRAQGIEGRTFNVCAGEGAIELGRLLDVAYSVWSESDQWRRKGISLPALTELETYELFERTVEETADPRLRAITKSLSHFVPQLSLPKTFDVSGTEAVTGRKAPDVRSFWEPMVRHLIETRWAAAVRRAA